MTREDLHDLIHEAARILRDADTAERSEFDALALIERLYVRGVRDGYKRAIAALKAELAARRAKLEAAKGGAP
jgi:hypothetical protein